MNRINIIREMLSWVESNLERPLTLDAVTARVGYSKWHLQRLFKSVTGQRLGSYLRARRLSAAAKEIRLTNRSLLDIANKYQFTDQQTFSRAFKKYFGIPPVKYRQASTWPKEKLCPPINIVSIKNIPQIIRVEGRRQASESPGV